MSNPTPDTMRRRIVENAKNPTKLRLAALREMVRPSVAFLIRLEKDPALPHKLMIEVVRRREAETQVRRIVRKSNNAAPRTGPLSREAGSVPHGQEAALQQIAEDSRRSQADREAARNQLGQASPSAFDNELVALLEGRIVPKSYPHQEGGKYVDVAPHVRQAYSDLRHPKLSSLLGGFPNFDYRSYFDRLMRLHSETGSEIVRVKAQEAITYFAENGQPEIKTLASEAIAQLRRVEGPAQAKAANP